MAGIFFCGGIAMSAFPKYVILKYGIFFWCEKIFIAVKQWPNSEKCVHEVNIPNLHDSVIGIILL